MTYYSPIFIPNEENVTNRGYRIVVKRVTRKVLELFKDAVVLHYPEGSTYKATCDDDSGYIWVDLEKEKSFLKIYWTSRKHVQMEKMESSEGVILDGVTGTRQNGVKSHLVNILKAFVEYLEHRGLLIRFEEY
jgi:hypothetical protein